MPGHQRDEPLDGEISIESCRPTGQAPHLDQTQAVHGQEKGVENEDGIELMTETVHDEGEVARDRDDSQRNHRLHAEGGRTGRRRRIRRYVHPVQFNHDDPALATMSVGRRAGPHNCPDGHVRRGWRLLSWWAQQASETGMTKILIVDDHPLYREGVMTALRGQPLRALVLGASSAGKALRILDDNPTVRPGAGRPAAGKRGRPGGARPGFGARHPPIARMLISARNRRASCRLRWGPGPRGSCPSPCPSARS